MSVIQREYFEWMYSMMCDGHFPNAAISFRKLFKYLHSVEFTFTIPKDINRAKDGENLRYRFSLHRPDLRNVEEALYGPCSVLEMMVALAIRCEESIMDDPTKGDRTSQWFWGMINNLGLGSMYDSRFYLKFVEESINIFLNREYEPDGERGLFTVRYSRDDFRDLEIWAQLCRYLNSIA